MLVKRTKMIRDCLTYLFQSSNCHRKEYWSKFLRRWIITYFLTELEKDLNWNMIVCMGFVVWELRVTDWIDPWERYTIPIQSRTFNKISWRWFNSKTKKSPAFSKYSRKITSLLSSNPKTFGLRSIWKWIHNNFKVMIQRYKLKSM